MFCAPEASRLLLRSAHVHGKPGLKHRNNEHRWIRNEISHDFWDRYWLFVVQNDAMANAIAYRNLMFPELCCQISDDIKFVNQQSSGSRNINISWIRKILIYVFFSFFVDPQNCELEYAKILWIHKIWWTYMTKFCGSIKFWSWMCCFFCGSTKFGHYRFHIFMDPQNFVHTYVIFLWIHKNGIDNSVFIENQNNNS